MQINLVRCECHECTQARYRMTVNAVPVNTQTAINVPHQGLQNLGQIRQSIQKQLDES